MSTKTLREIRAARKVLAKHVLELISPAVKDFEENADISPVSIDIRFVDVTTFGDGRVKRIPSGVKIYLEDI
jgi:hypothetical protein